MGRDIIFDEKTRAMAAGVTRLLDPELLEKGKEHCRQGRVEYARLFGPRIYAQVKDIGDGKKYVVQFHIDNFPLSTCTCAGKQLCEHIAAVFFHHYGDMPAPDGIYPGAGAPARGLTSPAKQVVQTKKALPVPTPEGPVESWYKYYEHQYRRLREAKNSYLYSFPVRPADETYFTVRLYDEFTSRLSLQCERWPLPARDLFRLYGCLFFMAGLEEQTEGREPSSGDGFGVGLIEDDFDDAFSSVAFVLSGGSAEYQDHLLRLVEIVHLFLFQDEKKLFDWLWIYRLLCGIFGNSPERWEEERTYLEETIKKAGENRQKYYTAALALASLYITGGRKEAALAVLRKPKGKRVGDMLFYLDCLAGAEDWDTLLAWLRWLAPAVLKAKPGVVESVCRYCARGAEKSGMPDQFVKLFRFWLPHGRVFPVYANYLLEAGLYREWVELNLSYLGHAGFSINKGDLRYLESQEPAVLIPLYHQWAARLIETKGRKSYQAAVRLLKKLRSIYLKQKRKKEWETFISRLASYYPRLRAFQEELRKGKLISL